MKLTGSEFPYSLSSASPTCTPSEPGSIVGSMEIDGLSVLIEPKMGIPQLLSLACYAMSRFKPQRELFDYQDELALPDVLAPRRRLQSARRAFAPGHAPRLSV